MYSNHNLWFSVTVCTLCISDKCKDTLMELGQHVQDLCLDWTHLITLSTISLYFDYPCSDEDRRSPCQFWASRLWSADCMLFCHVRCCRGLSVCWKPDQADWLYPLDNLQGDGQRSDLCRFYNTCSVPFHDWCSAYSHRLSDLVVVVDLFTAHTVCVCSCLFVYFVWNCVIHPFIHGCHGCSSTANGDPPSEQIINHKQTQ